MVFPTSQVSHKVMEEVPYFWWSGDPYTTIVIVNSISPNPKNSSVSPLFWNNFLKIQQIQSFRCAQPPRLFEGHLNCHNPTLIDNPHKSHQCNLYTLSKQAQNHRICQPFRLLCTKTHPSKNFMRICQQLLKKSI